MRYSTRQSTRLAEGDMTPMIDMTFQLIAFFMVVIGFADADQNERIKLPSSELAKPPEVPFDLPLTLQLTKQGTVLFAGDELSLAEFRRPLWKEYKTIKAQGSNPNQVTVIIRADRKAKAGRVQELIKLCQDTRFEKFALRAKQEERTQP